MNNWQIFWRWMILFSFVLSGVGGLMMLLPLTPTSAQTARQVQVGGITVTKTVNVSEINQDDNEAEVTYTITLQNGGTAYQGPLTLTDVIPAGTRCNGSIDDGGRFWTTSSSRCIQQGIAQYRLLESSVFSANATVNFEFTVVPTTTDGAILTNDEITLVGGNPPLDLTFNTSNETNVVVNAPEWNISKTADVSTVERGDLIEYTITARNVGSIATSGRFTIRDTVPDNSSYVTSDTPADITNLPEVVWQFDQQLAPNEAVQLSFTVQVDNTVNNGDVILNDSYSVSGGYAAGVTTGAPVAVAVDAPVTLDFRKTGPASANVGDTVRYELTLQNDANSGSSVSGIFAADTLPEGLTPTRIGYVRGNGADDIAYFNTGFVAVWEINRTLDVGEEIVLFVEATVDADVADGTQLVNQEYELFPLPGTPPFDTTPDPPPAVTTTINGPAALIISKRSPTTIAEVDDLIVYTIVVTNVSDRQATNISLRDVVPTNTTFDAANSSGGWSCADGAPAETVCTLNLSNLAGGSSVSRLFAVRVDSFVAAQNATIDNSVTVNYSSNPAPPTPLTNNTAAAETIRVDVPGVLLEPETQTAVGEPGVTVTYPLTVTNTGNNADTITLTITTEAFNATVDMPLLNLTPFESRVVQVSVVIPTGTALGTADTVGIEAQSTVAPSVTDFATLITLVSDAPDLAVVKGPSEFLVQPGGLINYGLFYLNQSDIAATGVVITETVYPFTSFADDPFLWQQVGSSNQYRFEVGQVAPNTARALEFTVRVNENAPIGLTLENRLTIGDDGALGLDPDLTNNVAVVTGTVTDAPIASNEPELLLAKDDQTDSAQPGESIRYDLSFVNRGGSAATGVVISETIPLNTTANLNASLPTVWNCPNGISGGDVCVSDIGTIGAGASRSVEFVVVVNGGLSADVTQVENRAIIADASRSTVATATVVTAIDNPTAPILSLNKTDAAFIADRGETINYTLSYQNSGSGAATGVIINEVVPANTTFNEAASTAGWLCEAITAGSICLYTVGTLAANSGQQTVNFAVTVDADIDTDTPSIGNIATIEDEQGNQVAAVEITTLNLTPLPSDFETVYLPLLLFQEDPPADLVVTEVTVSDLTPSTGQAVTLEVTIANRGGQPAFGDFWVDLYLATERITPQSGRGWEDAVYGGIEVVPYGVVWRVYGLTTGESQLLTNLAPNDPPNLNDNYSNFIPSGLGNWPQTWRGVPLTNSFHTPGRYYLYVQVDSLQNIAEGNESNNVFGPITIDATGPAFPFDPLFMTNARQTVADGARLTVQP